MAAATTPTTDRIRNIVLVGHGGAGKTALGEALIALGGIAKGRGGLLDCVGGNTSKGGQDNNGGGVYRQQRKAGLIGVARPRYATG